ncbi:hypothetical protein DSO57_1006782 [Entomophthora muscae]|uniref:Uncharacterized protein n=1 Tax=Entomophthora muscae TaxID=34485 RepID=A0ACC2S9P1_9FUNG|nr:hypothetical protein DSO57_1006782 [Entomophthora muscae]
MGGLISVRNPSLGGQPVVFRDHTGQVFAGRAHVKNITDNNLLQDKILCTIDLKSQEKKLQQFPLIKETASKQQVFEKEFKNSGFIPSRTAGCQLSADCKPAAIQPPLAHSATQPAGGSAPPTAGPSNLPDGETAKLRNQKRQFPQTQI